MIFLNNVNSVFSAVPIHTEYFSCTLSEHFEERDYGTGQIAPFDRALREQRDREGQGWGAVAHAEFAGRGVAKEHRSAESESSGLHMKTYLTCLPVLILEEALQLVSCSPEFMVVWTLH